MVCNGFSIFGKVNDDDAFDNALIRESETKKNRRRNIEIENEQVKFYKNEKKNPK